MPSRPYRKNCIDATFHSQIIYSIFNKVLSYTDTIECYGYPCETIKSIARAFEENWIVKRLQVDANITIESLHR